MLTLLAPAAFAAAAVSGMLGMGGGTLLLAVLTLTLDPLWVVPVHGAVQLASNSTRSVFLLSRVRWSIVLRYVPLMVVGAAVGIQLYRGASAAWFRPAVGWFILASLGWGFVKPDRLRFPEWIYVPAGFGGGFLTVVIGVAGPYLAAFFLRDDLERREIVATKAAIQTLGHFLKIPAFLSIGFRYGEHLGLILPLIACVIAGTWLGTRLLAHLSENSFRWAFRTLLFTLAVRLLI